ncbi:hypothetical protein LSTR_LSTR010254 [Laodelphax striatellus]|uniref:Uncharacterized protein n=1 Tax=Laodelphax striatellus TaxID=195883 RepID=A0A482WLT2_LAOST|nr:hypothetical protein LSTR_LSTR010254 [Laodelphax striatellus]
MTWQKVSDIDGDSDAEDDLPRTIPDVSPLQVLTSQNTSVASISNLDDIPTCSTVSLCEPPANKKSFLADHKGTEEHPASRKPTRN